MERDIGTINLLLDFMKKQHPLSLITRLLYNKDDANRHANKEGNIHVTSKLYKELKATKECCEMEKYSSQGKAQQLVIQYQVLSFENISIQGTLYGLSRLYLYI